MEGGVSAGCEGKHRVGWFLNNLTGEHVRKKKKRKEKDRWGKKNKKGHRGQS